MIELPYFAGFLDADGYVSRTLNGNGIEGLAALPSAA